MGHVAVNPGLAALCDEYRSFTLALSPTTASLQGYHEYDAELEDLSRDAEDTAIATFEVFAARAEAIDPNTLSADERVSREVLHFDASTQALELRSRPAEFAVDSFQGIQVVLLQLAGQLPITEPEHATAVVEKWSKMGRLVDQAIGRLRQGVTRNRTPPVVAVEKTLAQLDGYLASPVADDGFATMNPPASFDEIETARWREALTEQIRTVIRPAFARYRTAIADEVLPQSRPQERSGVVWLEDGAEVYARAIQRHTSLERTPLEIHTTGVDEIARLEDEYRVLGGSVLGTSELPTVYSRLRDDPDLRFADAEEVVAAAQGAMDRAAQAVPGWFGRLPKVGCVMAEMPPVGAEDAPLAFYLSPAADGSRPGTYFINTTEPTTRSRYESEALAYHESIPGHHLQLTIAQELDHIPEFRRHGFITVFHEGWGLYSERLADEMGLYSGVLERMGILSFDSWRAGRLVVDTGIHALGWSRDEASEYLAANSPQALNNIVNEVDRYIAWPGQALAYKTGQLEMLAARSEAQRVMDDRFSISEFHDALLGSGSVPMETMHRLVREWSGTRGGEGGI